MWMRRLLGAVSVCALLAACAEDRAAADHQSLTAPQQSASCWKDFGQLGCAPGSTEASEEDLQKLQVGSSQTLEIANWNIRFFPSVAATPQHVADLIRRMDLDIIAVQEIADVKAFNRLVALLGDYQGVLSQDEYSAGNYQKTGLLVRSSLVSIKNTHNIFVGESSPFPRPPLQSELEVRRPDGSTLSFTLITLHLKAGGQDSDEARRRLACEKLKPYLDGLITTVEKTGLIVLGDWNDSLGDVPSQNVFLPMAKDSAHYSFLTAPLAGRGCYSYVPSPGLIDHQLVSTGLENALTTGKTMVMPLDRACLGYSYLDEVSDHLPVVSVFPL